jgi:hypothetical protein
MTICAKQTNYAILSWAQVDENGFAHCALQLCVHHRHVWILSVCRTQCPRGPVTTCNVAATGLAGDALQDVDALRCSPPIEHQRVLLGDMKFTGSDRSTETHHTFTCTSID